MKIYVPVLILSLTACATQYEAPAEDSQKATINLVNENHLSSHTLFGFEQAYVSVADQSCSMPVEITRFSKVSKDYKPVPVEAGKEINILAYNIYGGTKSIDDVRLGKQFKECKSMASFVPEDGKNYIIRMKETNRKQCELFVVDFETKMAPTTLNVKNKVKCG